MTALFRAAPLLAVGAALCLLAVVLGPFYGGRAPGSVEVPVSLGIAALVRRLGFDGFGPLLIGVGVFGGLAQCFNLAIGENAIGGPQIWLTLFGLWLSAWGAVAWASSGNNRMRGKEAPESTARLRRFLSLLIPVFFGFTLLALWELGTRGLGVSPVLLPSPSAIWARILASPEILWADFLQTFVKGALTGYAIGCGAGVLTAIAIDRSPFLQRGLLPVGNLAAALPIIGIAPIMVMWFGFDWPSKAAVVAVMCFFPMLVNTVEGLRAADRLSLDLMRTYGAGYGQTLAKLRLPAAAPFLFNGLKICSTLALIGAIVAEFFGTPIVGMGFRISTEVGRMNLDMVWAEIAMAALVGSAFYGVVTLLERLITFWHPSVRR